MSSKIISVRVNEFALAQFDEVLKEIGWSRSFALNSYMTSLVKIYEKEGFEFKAIDPDADVDLAALLAVGDTDES